MSAYCMTCPHTYSQGFTLLCMHDYCDCLGLEQCRYPNSLKGLGLPSLRCEDVKKEERLPVPESLHTNPAFR